MGVFRALHLLIAESSFFCAWGMANIGVKLMPKNHPIRQYHEFSKERVRSLYIEAARAEQGKPRKPLK